MEDEALYKNAKETCYNETYVKELEDKAKDLEGQLDIYKPLFLSLAVLIVCACVFFCCLIFPARRRRQLRDLMRVENRKHEQSEVTAATPIITVDEVDNHKIKKDEKKKKKTKTPPPESAGLKQFGGDSPKELDKMTAEKVERDGNDNKGFVGAKGSYPRLIPDYGELVSADEHHRRHSSAEPNSGSHHLGSPGGSEDPSGARRKSVEAITRVAVATLPEITLTRTTSSDSKLQDADR